MQPDPPHGSRAIRGHDLTPEMSDSPDNVLATLDDVIAEIEAASIGSETLDARIHFGFRVMVGQSQDLASLLIAEGISWPTVKAALDDVIPPFTTSLDASLDGERIVFVLRSEKRRRWGAMQRTASGQEVLGWARTEPLARRLAALKSWRTDLAAAIEESGSSEAIGGDDTDSIISLTADRVTPQSQASPNVTELETETATSETPETEKKDGDGNSGKDKDWEVLF